MDDEPDRGRFRRLPPRVRPTGTEQDVSAPPPPEAEARYVSWLSPAGSVQGYEQLADYLTTEPRRSVRRTVALVILGGVLLLSLLVSLLTLVF